MAGFGYISIYKTLIVSTTGAAVRPFLVQQKTIYSKKKKNEISLCLRISVKVVFSDGLEIYIYLYTMSRSFVASVETTQVGPHLYSFFGTSRCHCYYHTPLYNSSALYTTL